MQLDDLLHCAQTLAHTLELALRNEDIVDQDALGQALGDQARLIADFICEAQALVEAHLLNRGCAESLVKEPQRQCRGSFVTRPVDSKKATRVAPKWVSIFDRPTVLVPRRSQRWP
jgi:hypothetical protein